MVKNLLKALVKEIKLPINMYVHNQSALKLIKNPVFHPRIKRIDVKYHFVRDMYNLGPIEFKYVCTNSQLADGFTKALPTTKFSSFVSDLGTKDFTFV